jgi:ribosomal protein L24E
MEERAKCWGCGKFVPIGKGITGLVVRTNGHEQYFCDKCLKKGAELKDGSTGTEMDWLKERDWVKEFKIV